MNEWAVAGFSMIIATAAYIVSEMSCLSRAFFDPKRKFDVQKYEEETGGSGGSGDQNQAEKKIANTGEGEPIKESQGSTAKLSGKGDTSTPEQVVSSDEPGMDSEMELDEGLKNKLINDNKKYREDAKANKVSYAQRKDNENVVREPAEL